MRFYRSLLVIIALVTFCTVFGSTVLYSDSNSTPGSAGKMQYGEIHVVEGVHLNQTTSTNWAGYQLAAGPLAYNSVQGTWIVPAVAASSTNTASATWTGIGGGCIDLPNCTATEATLIQAGTDQDYTGGRANYYAWWEALPAPSVPLSGAIISSGKNYDVRPGDLITVTITASPKVLWTIKIEDVRSGVPHWTFTTSVPYVEPGLTAEWIEESPLSAGTGGAGQLALSNFRRVRFSRLEVDRVPPKLTSKNKIIMTNGSGKVLARPSLPGSNGFAVCWGSGTCI